MIVKLLGIFDILAGVLFLLLALNQTIPFYIIWIFMILLFAKGLFILSGEFILSPIDLVASIILLLSLFVTIPILLFYLFSFAMVVKGSFSFL
ncbi:MAG: hypothetical protein N3D20_03015 [Candidatus Pacearchaeota archaeon]|nr:hypothetical protein [Candidatus Pacearchaeota archaeon]